jgi:hypothetical protein
MLWAILEFLWIGMFMFSEGNLLKAEGSQDRLDISIVSTFVIGVILLALFEFLPYQILTIYR